MKNLATILLLLTVTFSNLLAQSSNPPKREFRAAWVATVTNIDWPSSKSLSSTSQKNEVIAILDKHKANNINAILLQVRPSCDAFYQGGYEPLSEWLVGSQGGNLSSYYDPLQFWIDEAHKRGMELHAWINPYRSVVAANSSIHSSHISQTHPEWNINYGGSPYKFLDPGLPEVREYVIKVVMDIVRRYNIDGIHYDDYFYPYGGMTNQDSVSWGLYGSGTKGDWRRNNVNTFVAALYDSIKAVKPWVKYGISPFGIWRPNNPPGISGLDAYATIYCDALNWISNRKVDYLTPQLYWVIGGSQDYSKLMPWWASYTKQYGRHLYTGNAVYRIQDSNWPSTEILNQIELNRLPDRAQGVVFFSSKSVTNNLKGIQDSLRNNQFRYLALPPAMPWLDSVPPLPPTNLAAIPSGTIISLDWQQGAVAGDGDTAKYFVVYRAVNELQDIDIANPKYIRYVSMDGTKHFADTIPTLSNAQYQAVVLSYDKLWNESPATQKVYIAPSGKPYLALQQTSLDLGEIKIGNSAAETMYVYNRAATSLTISSTNSGTPVFSAMAGSGTVADSTPLAISFTPSDFGTVTDTIYLVNNSVIGTAKIAVKGSSPRPTLKLVSTGVIFGNARVGDTTWKSVSITNQSLNTFKVDSVGFVASSRGVFHPVAVTYPFDVVNSDTVSLNVAFVPDTIKVFFDTLLVYSNAQNSPTKVIFYGVGQDPMSVDQPAGIQPLAYVLKQNYPNPFNPTTTLSFTLQQSGHAVLKVYDLLGREVATIVDENLDAGTHRYEFNGAELSSGVYLYRLVSGEFAETKKMILQK